MREAVLPTGYYSGGDILLEEDEGDRRLGVVGRGFRGSGAHTRAAHRGRQTEEMRGAHQQGGARGCGGVTKLTQPGLFGFALVCVPAKSCLIILALIICF